ncbi:hypothetical protein AB0M35_25785 [Micromonospora sp. NPDC051196]|uniref:hypothetical protein n=1 Tax=Micromonospora sp. NPDC051196 TaxID=3155281 RepID=UPI00342006E5
MRRLTLCRHHGTLPACDRTATPPHGSAAPDNQRSDHTHKTITVRSTPRTAPYAHRRHTSTAPEAVPR